MKGVTIHKQLLKENHPYPRRQKLAVKIDRPVPSSRLKQGKYYAHVHQVKIYNRSIGTRWLGTRRFIKKLVTAFGSSYYPKQRQGVKVHANPKEKNATPVISNHVNYQQVSHNRNMHPTFPLPINQLTQPPFAYQFQPASKLMNQNKGFFKHKYLKGWVEEA